LIGFESIAATAMHAEIARSRMSTLPEAAYSDDMKPPSDLIALAFGPPRAHKQNMNRRKFLQLSAAGLAFSILSSRAADLAGPKKRVGLIGPGWYGKCDLIRLIQIAPVEVVSLADPDKRMLAQAAEILGNRQESKKKPRTYADYREMLKEKDLDIVLIATPDHWHALNAIAAMEAGADLYLQKPISVDISEGQAILAAARKLKRVVQVGTQRRSTPHLIEARDRIIKEGKLGKVAYADICCYYHMRSGDTSPASAPPEYLDFDLWTGPAPMRPFHRIMHPRGWRAFMEYGNGIVGDMCVHMLDMVRWMLDLGWPKSVNSSGGILVDKKSVANIADTQTATFDFGDIKINWVHRSWGDAPDPKYPWAAVLYGDKGTLKASVNSYEFTPAGGGQSITGEALFEYEKYPEDRTEKDLERHVASAIRGHMQNLLDCIASRGRPVADIEEGHISTASCILANISMKLGRSLTWDPAKGEVVGDAEANQLLRRPYRSPYVHPAA
jgi:predicted dehydrogenase